MNLSKTLLLPALLLSGCLAGAGETDGSEKVKLDFEKDRIPVPDAKCYRDTVRAAFLSRRKTLENNLVNAFSLPRERAQALLAEAGIPEKARGETLTPQQLAALSALLYREKTANA